MIPVICIIGEQDSGKTTLVEKLIGELVRRGYRVSTIKHTAHPFELDREGSDSYRHTKAGAIKVALSHSAQFAMIEKRMDEKRLEKIVSLIEPDTDIILAEGYKWLKNYPKIKLIKDGEKTISKGENIVATVGGGCPIKENVPDFDMRDVGTIADFLEGRFMKKMIEEKGESVRLEVNGKDIRIKGFVQDILAKTILGMISTLRGTENPKEVEIRIKCESR